MPAVLFVNRITSSSHTCAAVQQDSENKRLGTVLPSAIWQFLALDSHHCADIRRSIALLNVVRLIAAGGDMDRHCRGQLGSRRDCYAAHVRSHYQDHCEPLAVVSAAAPPLD